MRFCKGFRPKCRTRASEKGVTLIELIVVLTIVAILSAISIPYIFRYTQKYKTEDQALKVMDFMREAGQLALNRRRTMRVELDVSNSQQSVLRLFDENGAAADVLLKSIPLEPASEVRMDVQPNGVGLPPPNYANAAFNTSSVWTAVFDSDGTVVTTAGVPVSATLYFWSPQVQHPFTLANLNARSGEVRAVTLFGGSGAVRYWKHDGTTWTAWQ